MSVLPSANASSELVISQRFGPRLRLVLAVLGLFGCAVVFRDLGSGLWPIGLNSLFIGTILAGGMFVCGFLVLSAFFGECVTVVVRDNFALIERHSPFGVRREILSRGAVTSARAVPNEWDSRADTWRVAIAFADGREMLTPDLASRAEAENAAMLIERWLGQTSSR